MSLPVRAATMLLAVAMPVAALAACTPSGGNCYTDHKTSCLQSHQCVVKSCTLESNFWDLEHVDNIQDMITLDGCIVGDGIGFHPTKPGKEIMTASFKINDNAKLFLETLHTKTLFVGDNVYFEGGVFDERTFGRNGGFGSNSGHLLVGVGSTIKAELAWLPNFAIFEAESTALLDYVRWQLTVPEDNSPVVARLVVGEGAFVEIGLFITDVFPTTNGLLPITDADGVQIEIGSGGKLVVKDSLDLKKGSMTLIKGASAEFTYEPLPLYLRAGGTITLSIDTKLEVQGLSLCGGTVFLESGAVLIVNRDLVICGEATITGPGEVRIMGAIKQYEDGALTRKMLSITGGVKVNCTTFDGVVSMKIDHKADLVLNGGLVTNDNGLRRVLSGVLKIVGHFNMTGGNLKLPNRLTVVVKQSGNIKLKSLYLGTGSVLNYESTDAMLDVESMTIGNYSSLVTTGTIKTGNLNLWNSSNITSRQLVVTAMTNSIKDKSRLDISEKAVIRFSSENRSSIGDDVAFYGGIFDMKLSEFHFGHRFISSGYLQLDATASRAVTFSSGAKLSVLDVKNGGEFLKFGVSSKAEKILVSGDAKQVEVPGAFIEHTQFIYLGDESNKTIIFTWLCGKPDDKGKAKRKRYTIPIEDRKFIWPTSKTTEVDICGGGDSPASTGIPEDPIALVGIGVGPQSSGVDRDLIAMVIGIVLAVVFVAFLIAVVVWIVRNEYCCFRLSINKVKIDNRHKKMDDSATEEDSGEYMNEEEIGQQMVVISRRASAVTRLPSDNLPHAPHNGVYDTEKTPGVIYDTAEEPEPPISIQKTEQMVYTNLVMETAGLLPSQSHYPTDRSTTNSEA